VQVIGPAFGEAVALRAAAAIERAAGTLGMPPGLSAEPA
jgi:Asp-tRNA(Asn)/Glu-tRNA(Gln) amidotransferase A subunit family amidase